MDSVKDIVELLAGQDPEVGAAVQVEYDRQRCNIELIAPENFVSPAVLAATATALTSKYAEGYPGKRYYGSCQCVDVVEDIVRKRTCQLFGADHTNVQPHCGASANHAAYVALCEHGGMVLGMDLASGGHLTHGSPANFSGKNHSIVAYGVNDQGYIDHDQVHDLAEKYRPRTLLADVSAYLRTIDLKTFADIAHEVGAYLFVDMAHTAGPVTVGLHPSLVPYADVVTTITHKTLRGLRGDMTLCKEALARKIDSATFPGSQDDPLEHIITTKAVALGEAMKPEFKAYQEQILKDAAVLVKVFMAEGSDLVSGDTDSRLMLMDLRPARFIGKEMERQLDEVNITVNKNAIPNDPEKPFVTSDIRVGIPAATTCGFKEAGMEAIASIMWRTATDSEGRQDELRNQLAQLTGKYSLYE